MTPRIISTDSFENKIPNEGRLIKKANASKRQNERSFLLRAKDLTADPNCLNLVHIQLLQVG